MRIPLENPASKKGRCAMSKRMICSLVAVLVLILPVSGVWAAEMLPEGVTMVVLKESPVTHLPGIAKVATR